MARRIKGEAPSGGTNIAVPSEGGSTDHLSPEFSLSHIQNGYCVKDCEEKQRAALMVTLRDMAQRSWGEIKKLHRHKGGFEELPELSSKVPAPWKGRTPIAFRFQGMNPVIGIRQRQTFHILWVDAKRKMYSH